jgi:hypothetical protein
MTDVRVLTLEAVLDDWISDYEMQGDYEQEADLEPPDAFGAMVRQATEWIDRGVLVPGQMLENGFVPWPSSATESSRRLAAEAGGYETLTRPGQICWFDSGPNAEAELGVLQGLE